MQKNGMHLHAWDANMHAHLTKATKQLSRFNKFHYGYHHDDCNNNGTDKKKKREKNDTPEMNN